MIYRSDAPLLFVLPSAANGISVTRPVSVLRAGPLALEFGFDAIVPCGVPVAVM